jgi:hypothetical protein
MSIEEVILFCTQERDKAYAEEDTLETCIDCARDAYASAMDTVIGFIGRDNRSKESI